MSALVPHPSSLRGYRFVFVSDQGSVFGSRTPPTTEDLRLAGVGILIVVNLRTCRYYGREERWLPVPLAKLTASEFEGDPPKPFHARSAE
ncbi:hypothetical protein [Opitutus terrae]|uniref:Uncharacterized protein n=1 Tax=Opitutus terrae (strain DSM 11246 / JCM 15787 / PB90-1) TaxID=452637 RepID=B1ZV54_OPITP|nr:hypothetical protein [Opitutus terrae]ACB76721.1 hypothetical protein Oter_3444 [Opitutus terrae PB90-1]